MTVLGAVVFGGLLALGVLWLLVTAPDSDVEQAWSESPVTEPGTAPVDAVLTGIR
jgi:hypothetical protein